MGFKDGKGFSRRIAASVIESMATFAVTDGKYGRFLEVLVGVTVRHLSMQTPKVQAAILADITDRANVARVAAAEAAALNEAEEAHAAVLSSDAGTAELQAVEGLAADLLAQISTPKTGGAA